MRSVFTTDAFLGRNRIYGIALTFRSVSRSQSAIKLDTTRIIDPRSGDKPFDMKIFRAQTAYQFTPRLLIRNIRAERRRGLEADAV
jgi:hypothetical protein